MVDEHEDDFDIAINMDVPVSKSRGLGRGLSALFDDEEDDLGMESNEQQSSVPAPSDPTEAISGQPSGLQRRMVGIEQLQPGAYQPRLHFNDESLDQLAASISTHGILQPLLVRSVEGEGEMYEIIAGERRWRAAQKSQLHEVPVIVHEMEDQTALEISLIENLQREDLNPLDEALGYQRLMNEFEHTQNELAQAVGKSRSHVANIVRLLQLPDEIQAMVREGSLSAGHARTLITAKDPIALAKKIIAQGLSVRQAEKLASEVSEDKKRREKVQKVKAPETVALEDEMSNILGMKLNIDQSSKEKGGMVKISYSDLDQLDDLLRRLSSSNRSEPAEF